VVRVDPRVINLKYDSKNKWQRANSSFRKAT
jgi:hypothetical protein